MADDGATGGPVLRVLAGGNAAASDGALLAAFLRGHEPAFDELWRRHHPTVHALVRRHARTPEDARDLVQRAFLRAVGAARRSPSRVGDDFPFRPWLLRIAVNLGKNHRRDEYRWRRAPLEAVEERGDGATPVDELLVRREQERRVREAVRELPRRQREVLLLRVDAGLPFAEVARTLGISEVNARVHFHHATRRLADRVRIPGEEEP